MTYEIRNVATILRHAQTFALTNTGESRYGVAFLSSEMILFKGNDYSTRNQVFDEIYPRSTTIAVSAPSEVVFESLSGNPTATSSIILGISPKIITVSINDYGAIDW